MNLMGLLGVVFVGSMQPVLMVSVLVIIVLLYSYILFMVLKGYWYSYMLMLVMLSGVLVVFTYMVTMLPNESFENYNLLMLLMVVLFLFKGVYTYMYSCNISFLTLSLWSGYLSVYNLFMVGFLFSMMLMVVWVSNMSGGAIRVNF